MNVTVRYEKGAIRFAQQMLATRPVKDDLARLAGALDGATVSVSAREKKGWLYLSVDDPARFEVYDTSLRRDANGNLFAYIHEVRTAAGQGGQGLGFNAFSRQVGGARALGLNRFELWAAGDVRDRSNNGYYTWARFGFDAYLGLEKVFLPSRLSGVKTTNDLMLNGGHLWWKQHGSQRSMVFDLAEDSSMMRVFRAYLKEKGILEKQ